MPRLLPSALVTLGALALGVWIAVRDAVHWPLGDADLFLTRPGEVALLWIVALGLTAFAWGGHFVLLRRLLVAAAVVAALAFIYGAVYRPTAERVQLSEATAPEGPRRKTLLVGIDALSWNRLLPLIREGRLPNFERLMEEGSYGVLHSYRSFRKVVGKSGYWSPVVWTTIATGVGSPQHGISGFNIQQGDRRVAAASHHRRAPAFWNLFGAFGRTTGTVGWWATWPAEEVDGIMASSGLGLRGGRARKRERKTGESRLTFPEEFADIVDREIRVPGDTVRFIDSRIFPISSYDILGEEKRGTLESVVWQDRFYHQIARYLLAEEDLDLYATYLKGIDLVSHLFWRYMDPEEPILGVTVPAGFDEQVAIVDRYYTVVDSFVGELMELAGPEATIVVCSDHGFRDDDEHNNKSDHSSYGVLLVKGDGVQKGQPINLTLAGSLRSSLYGPMSVVDVLPTLLYLHDLPVADELEGRVLYELFERSYLRQRQEIRVPGYGEFAATRNVEVELPTVDQEEYEERLRSLGYID